MKKTLAKKTRKWIRQTSLFSRLYYNLHIDDLLITLGRENFNKKFNDACQKFLSEKEIHDQTLLRELKKDMKRCYYQIKASPEEYFLYGLRAMSTEARSEFLTDKFMFMTLGRIIPRKQHDLEIEDKYHFYTIAKPYFQRRAVEVSSSADYPAFEDIALSVHDVMLKPNDACMGKGIEAMTINTKEDAKDAFEKIITAGGRWIVEERIRQSDSMAVWNETSCNTIRVLSFLNKKGHFIVTPFLRTGRKGAVVDNAGSGGVFANIDPDSGIVCTDGVDELGNRYETHPDSGLTFVGWKIPLYKELIDTVKEMHENIMPSHPYIGWDMALTDKGWVVIECNWGQFVNQIADKKGRRKEFLNLIYID